MILSQERESDLYLVFSKDRGEEERRRDREQAASRKGEEGGEGEEGCGEGKGAQPEIFSSQSFLKGEEGVGAQDDTKHGQSLLAPEQIHHHVVGEDDGHPV